jgi:hypothetical protein
MLQCDLHWYLFRLYSDWEESGMTLCSVAGTLTCSPSRYSEDELVLQRGRQSKGYLCLLYRIGLLKLKKT